jgi:DNA-binding MarR family transcriptional regulator
VRTVTETPRVPKSSILLELSTVAGLIRTLVDQALAGLEAREDFLTYTLLAVLGEANPTQVATHEGVPLTTVSDRLNRLVQRGHAEKVPNPADGRSSLYRLTETGWSAFWEAQPRFRAALEGVDRRLDMPLEEIRRAIESVERALREQLAEVNAEKTPVP